MRHLPGVSRAQTAALQKRQLEALQELRSWIMACAGGLVDCIVVLFALVLWQIKSSYSARYTMPATA